MEQSDIYKRQRVNLDRIFRAGLNRVDPYRMICDHVHLEGDFLRITVEAEPIVLDLNEYGEILILGAGKATAPMASAMEQILGERITAGLIVVKYGHVEPLKKIQTIEAGHPVPDQEGVRGAAELLRMAEAAGPRCLVINLISGGGSALLPLPACYSTSGEEQGLTLEDKQATTKALLACGAEITEINCVRKHLSAIKGGRLVEKIAPARSISFILSDVVGDDLSSIASGLTTADPTTYHDALAVIEKYEIERSIPEKVMQYLQRGEAGEIAESVKADSGSLSLTTNVLMGTNRTALIAAAKEAEHLGYTVVTLTSRITGEASEVAKMLSAIAADSREYGMLGKPPLCIISGGEPVVTLTGEGKGGRNQEMALAFLCEIEKRPLLFRNTCFLAASTDGNDGPTDAAGAFADLELLGNCHEKQLDIRSYLHNNDSYTLFSAVGGLYLTGPTNTNVCDLHMIVIG